MKFIINFSASHYNGVLMVEQRNHGTKLASLAYSSIGYFDIALLTVPSVTEYSFKVEIPYEMAISSGHFENVSELEVGFSRDSPSDVTEKFFKIEFSEERDLDTQEIISITANYVVDEELVLREWQESGFPTEWVVAAKNL